MSSHNQYIFFSLSLFALFATILSSFIVSNSVLLMACFLVLGLTMFLYTYSVIGFIANPLSTFVASWFLVSCIISFPWYHYVYIYGAQPFTSSFWLIYWIGTISFLFGLAVPLLRSKNIMPIVFDNLSIDYSLSERIRRITTLLFLSLITSFVISFMYIYRSVPVFNIEEFMHSDFSGSNIPGLVYVIHILLWITVSLSLINYIFSKERKLSLIHPVLFSISIALCFATGKKWALINIFFITLYFVLIMFRRNYFVVVSITAILLVLFFFSNHFLRGYYGKTYYKYDYTRIFLQSNEVAVKNPFIGGLILYPSLYTWQNFIVLQEYLDSGDKPMYGRRSFRFLFTPFLSLDEQLKLCGKPENMRGKAIMFLTDYYIDFRYAGVLLIPGLLGFLCAIFYLRIRRNIIAGLVVNSIVFKTIILLFAQNSFSELLFISSITACSLFVPLVLRTKFSITDHLLSHRSRTS